MVQILTKLRERCVIGFRELAAVLSVCAHYAQLAGKWAVSRRTLQTLLRSNLTKITNQLGGSLDLSQSPASIPAYLTETVLKSFDYGFAENGLTAFRLGKAIETQSFINFIGEDKYKQLVNFCLHYIADIDIPIKRWVHSSALIRC